MSFPSIGQVVRLQPIVPDEDIANKIYKTRVADIRDQHILFELPIEVANGRPLNLAKGTEFYFTYINLDGTQYRFRGALLGRVEENIPLILVKLPAKHEIEKSQRRSFLRVDAYLDLAVKLDAPDRIYHLVTQTTDISGGGLSFTCSPSYLFKEGDKLKLWLVIPTKDQGIARLVLDGEVVRVEIYDEVKKTRLVSVKFILIKDRDHQLLMRYCFERQLELYKKGIG